MEEIRHAANLLIIGFAAGWFTAVLQPGIAKIIRKHKEQKNEKR